jgi:hypothetical protein
MQGRAGHEQHRRALHPKDLRPVGSGQVKAATLVVYWSMQKVEDALARTRAVSWACRAR